MNNKENRLPVLNYHGVDPGGKYPWLDVETPYVLSTNAFDEQLDYLEAEGYRTLSLEEFDQWRMGRSFGPRAAVLTFDDGHLSHYEEVRPLLKKRKMKAVFFIPFGLIGQPGQMDVCHLNALAEEGLDLGSHGYEHIPLTGLSELDLQREIISSRRALEEATGREIASFSVPRGFFNSRIRRMAQSAGYRAVFTSNFDLAARSHGAFAVRRLAVLKSTSLEDFSRLLEGRLGTKKIMERVKQAARTYMAPRLYDVLADLKRTAHQGV